MDPVTLSLLMAAGSQGIGAYLAHRSAKKRRYPSEMRALDELQAARSRALAEQAAANQSAAIIATLGSGVRTAGANQLAEMGARTVDPSARAALARQIGSASEAQLANIKAQAIQQEMDRDAALRDAANEGLLQITSRRAQFEADRRQAMDDAVAQGITGVAGSVGNALMANALRPQATPTPLELTQNSQNALINNLTPAVKPVPVAPIMTAPEVLMPTTTDLADQLDPNYMQTANSMFAREQPVSADLVTIQPRRKRTAAPSYDITPGADLDDFKNPGWNPRSNRRNNTTDWRY